jgi:GT2 family glycosyltransferase
MTEPERTAGRTTISVVIATINRRDELRTTLQAYREQTHRPLELVVVDNGSTDGTREMMREEFPEAVYEWLPCNMGTEAINRGFALATGDVFWLSNNDSRPESADGLARVAALLAAHPEVDIVGSENLEMIDGGRIYDWHPIRVDKSRIPPGGFPTNLFHGTGAAVRRRVVDAIGGLWDVFGYEEMDFCARAIARGFQVRYRPDIRTLHFSSPRERVPTDRWVAAALNMMRYTWRHFPLGAALYRSTIYYPYFLLQGLAYPARPSEFARVIVGMPQMAFRTMAHERQVAPAAVRPQLTMGIGPLRLTWNHLRQVAARRLGRLRRARASGPRVG